MQGVKRKFDKTIHHFSATGTVFCVTQFYPPKLKLIKHVRTLTTPHLSPLYFFFLFHTQISCPAAFSTTFGSPKIALLYIFLAADFVCFSDPILFYLHAHKFSAFAKNRC